MASHFTYGAAIPDPHHGSQALRIGPLLCLGRVMSSEVRSVVCVQFLGNANLYYAPKFGTCFPISLLVLPLLYLATLISPSCHHLNVTVIPQPNVEPLFTFSMISSLPLMKLHSLHTGRHTHTHTHTRTSFPVGRTPERDVLPEQCCRGQCSSLGDASLVLDNGGHASESKESHITLTIDCFQQPLANFVMFLLAFIRSFQGKFESLQKANLKP